jgi:organic radical activating enzyme
MNKIIPIKLERVSVPRTTRVVEWRLGNTCNFDCSFCTPEFKDGTRKYLEYSRYIKLIDNLIDSDPSKKIWFQINGGEPTLYPKLIELLTYIKSKGGYTSMFSNGSRTVRWWKELADLNVLDRLYLSYHPEQDKTPAHIIEVNNIMQVTNALVTIFVTTQADPALFQKAVESQKEIQDNALSISSLKPITILGANTLQPYSPEQTNLIQKNLYVRSKGWAQIATKKSKYLKTVPFYHSDIIITYNDRSEKTASAQYLIESDNTNFKNWECDIGIDTLFIDVENVYRGQCRQGEFVETVSETTTFRTSPIICKSEKCMCSFDVQEPKRVV